MKRVTIDLEDELYRRVKVHCAEKDLKLTELMRKLLSEAVDKSDKKKKSILIKNRAEGGGNSLSDLDHNHRS